MFNNLAKKFYLIAITCCLSAYVVFFSIAENYKALFIPLLIPLGYFLLQKPKLIAYLFLLSSVRFLGFIDIEDFMNLPGLFKFDDLLFLALISIYFFDVLQRGLQFHKDNYAVRSIAYIVLLFIAMVVVQFVFTSIHYDLPIVSTLKVGRGFLYLLFYFYLLRFFFDSSSSRKLFRFIATLCIIQFIMMLLQISGLNFTKSTTVIELASDNVSVTRVYLTAYFFALLTFFVSVSLLLNKCDQSSRRLLLLIVIFSLSSIILSYTRTYWMAMLIGLIIIFVMSESRVKKNVVYYLCLGFTLFSPFLLMQSDSFIFERFISIFQEVGSDEGNFIYRFSENPQRLEAFIDNPVFGPGFVHSNYATTLFNFNINEQGLSESQIQRALLLQTNDSGLITLLVSFGLVGVFWVLYKFVVLFRLFLIVTGLDDNARAIIIGNISFITAVWLTCTTTYGFTYPDGIVALALSLFFISSCMKHKESMEL
ncbi:O-antigen ligase family protein [Photobacterium sagamiensis]|uniref:O-antigen ligase family protein n=1 Tax=Photobacterium sagamiensis TaxID=2910241 RepID=UPI003D0C09D9